MDTIVRNVTDIEPGDRRCIEHIVGHDLQDNQQLIIHVTKIAPASTSATPSCESSTSLPDWCNVYDGLSDEEIAQVEQAALDRSGWARPSA